MEMGMQSPVMSTTVHQDIGSTILRFFLRLAVLFFLTVDITAGMAYLLITRSTAWRELIPIALALICGVSAGFLTRLIYTGWLAFNRWIFACLSATGALALIGLATRQWLKMDLTGISTVQVEPDFFLLLAAACITAFFTVFAWRRKPVLVEPKDAYVEAEPEISYAPPIPSPVVVHASVGEYKAAPRRKRAFSIIPHDLQKKFFPKSRVRRWKRQVRNQLSSVRKIGRNMMDVPLRIFIPRAYTPSGRRKTAARLQIRVPEYHPASPSAFPMPAVRRHRGRRTPKTVRLIGKEEMRCPYCLQLIDPHDPKGIVVCPICHTAHHKECWDITGFCQVPHNHAVL